MCRQRHDTLYMLFLGRCKAIDLFLCRLSIIIFNGIRYIFPHVLVGGSVINIVNARLVLKDQRSPFCRYLSYISSITCQVHQISK